MPSGRKHLEIWGRWWAALLICTLLTMLLSKNMLIGAAMIMGYFLGRYISPDLDLIGITSDEGRMMRELKVLGLLISMWFMPYAYIMRFVGIGKRGHRNFFSHYPVISTFIRFLWLFAPLVVGITYWKPELFYDQYLQVVTVGLFFGLTYADTIHYLADMRLIR